MAELTPQLRERVENTIRFLTVDAVQRAGIGHLALLDRPEVYQQIRRWLSD